MKGVLTLEHIVNHPECATAAVELKGETFHLRPLQEDDASRLAEYFAGLSARTRGWFAPHEFTPDVARELCRDRLSQQTLRMVAVSGTKAPGIAAYFILQLGVRESERTRFASYGISLDGRTDCTLAPSVADACQGVGLGSAIMRQAIEVARKTGRTRMVLWGGVKVANHGAIHFYEKFGFRKVATFGPEAQNQDMILSLAQ